MCKGIHATRQEPSARCSLNELSICSRSKYWYRPQLDLGENNGAVRYRLRCVSCWVLDKQFIAHSCSVGVNSKPGSAESTAHSNTAAPDRSSTQPCILKIAGEATKSNDLDVALGVGRSQ